MNKILAICILIFILNFSITIHELGHYSIAKELNVAVKEFSVGIGPKVYSIKKDETEYALKLIPYGGYNKFYSKDEQVNDKLNYNDISYDQKLLILSMGIIINFITGFLFLFIFTLILGIPEPIDTKRKENENDKEYKNRINKQYINMKYNKVNIINSIKFIIQRILKIFPDFLSYIKSNPVKNIEHVNSISDSLELMLCLLKNNKFYIIFLIGIINIGLGIFNILPIYPLDGGKFILILTNEIFGYNEYVNTIFTYIGFILLSILLSIDLTKDTSKIIFSKYKRVHRKHTT